jgi:hypothetical protein
MQPLSDPALVDRIEKLAQYVAQSNGAMEATVRERQRTNPNFAFLFGGDGADYYKQCLHRYSQGPQGGSCGGGGGVSGNGGYGGGATTTSMGPGSCGGAVYGSSSSGPGPGACRGSCAGSGYGGGGNGGGMYGGGAGPGGVTGGPLSGGGGCGAHGGPGVHGGYDGGAASHGGGGLPPYLGAYKRAADYPLGGGAGGGYGAPPPPAGGAHVNEDRIFDLLERRDECRRRKDWVGADRLKEELGSVFNVIN